MMSIKELWFQGDISYNPTSSSWLSVGFNPYWLAMNERGQILQTMFVVNDRQSRLYGLFASYPLSMDDPIHCCQPLLANRPLQVRSSTSRTPTFEMIIHRQDIPSFLREKYQFFYDDLMKRLHVDMSLLDYNYTRLNHYIQEFKRHRIHLYGFFPEELEDIHEYEYPMALEFYLQFDIDLFFMKTCSYRHAEPRFEDEGLFCRQEPSCQYDLSDCGNCGLCYPRHDRQGRMRTSMVTYQRAHQYQSLNGYRIILNCPATCHTNNVIYTLKCVCQQYEYVGVTMYSLHDRLRQHRGHFNRIIHEFLLGEENIQRDLVRPKSKEIQRKDRMKLYRHVTQCPVALQHFLNENPEYWPFIPMTNDQAQLDDQKTMLDTRSYSTVDDQHHRSLSQSRIYIQSVPKPPNGYLFSSRQQEEQLWFFQMKKDLCLFKLDTDLYYASIIAVLPEQCSNAFRCLIESMFITHMNPKLNSIGNLIESFELSDTDHWCSNLFRPISF